MKTLAKHTTLGASVIASLMMTSTAFAAPAEAPNVFVKRIADPLVQRLKTDAPKIKSNPALGRQIVQQYIEPHIDSQGFALSVMGVYKSNQHSTKEQRALFEKNLKQSLMTNYAPMLAQYANNTYTTPRVSKADPKNPQVSMVFTHQGKKYPVEFTLVDKNNQWKIANLTVEGINIGLTFREQFAQAVQRNGNDVGKTINSFKPSLPDSVKK